MADVLGAFEQAVLLTIVRLRDEAYGRAVLNGVKQRLDREIAAGAVHSTLDRLEGKGLVASTLSPGTPIRAGRARRYYTIRPGGLRALNESKAVIDGIWDGLGYPLKGRI